jgi:hypothetical protein
MIDGMDYTRRVWEDWDSRLRRARGLIFDLPTETEGLQLDHHARWTHSRVVLPAGTRVQYVETRYDAMIPDRCHHTVKVVSGPAAGSWVGLADEVGPGPLLWEQ